MIGAPRNARFERVSSSSKLVSPAASTITPPHLSSQMPREQPNDADDQRAYPNCGSEPQKPGFRYPRFGSVRVAGERIELDVRPRFHIFTSRARHAAGSKRAQGLRVVPHPLPRQNAQRDVDERASR